MAVTARFGVGAQEASLQYPSRYEEEPMLSKQPEKEILEIPTASRHPARRHRNNRRSYARQLHMKFVAKCRDFHCSAGVAAHQRQQWRFCRVQRRPGLVFYGGTTRQHRARI